MTRAQLYTPNIKFENDERLKEFVVIIWRDNGVNYGGVDGEVERIPFFSFKYEESNFSENCWLNTCFVRSSP